MRKSLAILAAFWLAVPAQAQDAMLIGAGSPAKVSAGGGYVGPGDVTGYTTGIFGWWGFRAFNNACAVAHCNVAKVCNNSGTTTGANCQTITANTNGTITPPAAGACNGSNCTLVMTLYDQSGANNCSGPCDVTQSTTANMPPFNTGGVISASLLGTTAHWLPTLVVFSSGLSQPFTASAVANRTVDTANNLFYMTNALTGGGLLFPHQASGALASESWNTTISNSTVLSLGTAYAMEFTAAGASSKIQVLGTVQSPGTSGTGGFSVGDVVRLSDSAVTGDIINFTEGGLWSTDRSASFSNMETNQRTFWGI